ncbi:potassium-transporting ATPase subunit KdpA [Acidiplasma sp.]|uniref:potassium-transporting ATPase subunit KdpA n=1 Tax=Acidiplasma sp. TaxID=1872114 RepID=UPI0025851578|nr:potassium-transporting ATPase subunit KdpA [Acidiplasma sp.]
MISIYSLIDSNREISGLLIVFFYIIIALFFGYLISGFIRKIYLDQEEKTWIYPVSGRIVNFFERFLKEDKNRQMDFKEYFLNLLIFNFFAGLIGIIFIYFQNYLPYSHANNHMTLSLIVNTVVSFLTNTNLEHFSNPFDLSILSWTFVITGLMFLSAGTGFAASMAFIRAILNDNGKLGNFYHDFLISIFYVIFPLTILFTVILVLSGVPETLSSYINVLPIGSNSAVRLPLGPVATLVSIKGVGTNGGGFYGANAAYPLGNPNWFTNIVEYVSFMLVPLGSVFSLRLIFDKRFGNMVIGVLTFIFVFTSVVAFIAEYTGIPAQSALALYTGNMAGKDVYLGLSESTVFQVGAVFTSTGASTGGIIDYTPIGLMSLLTNLVLNDPLGGIGTGIINIFTYIIFTVFITSLMVGKLPELMNIRIGSKEMKYSTLSLITHPLIILIPLGITLIIPAVMHTFYNGFSSNISDLLYEFSSSASNNGSEAGGFLTNSPYFNYLDSLIMLLGRYLMMGIQLLLAQQFAFKKPKMVYEKSTIDTGSFSFGFMLLAVIIMVGLLSYIPVFSLGTLYDWARDFNFLVIP